MTYRAKLLWVGLFAIAMGFLETAVVIYLRELYYPHGFSFPLLPMPRHIAVVEMWREAATIIMLAAVGILAGTRRSVRFAWFIYAFAIWDICYYVFLYLFLGWPRSLLTWDILFLLPVPWVGPVVCPVIISLLLIGLAATVNYYDARGTYRPLGRTSSWLLLAGSMIVIWSFTRDYISQFGLSAFGTGHKALLANLQTYVPAHFDWWIFIPGSLLMTLAWVLYMYRRQGNENVN